MLEIVKRGASQPKLLTLDDKRRVELDERLGIVPLRTDGTCHDQLPQSHGRSIGATAPKLRPAPHMGEPTTEVG